MKKNPILYNLSSSKMSYLSSPSQIIGYLHDIFQEYCLDYAKGDYDICYEFTKILNENGIKGKIYCLEDRQESGKPNMKIKEGNITDKLLYSICKFLIENRIEKTTLFGMIRSFNHLLETISSKIVFIYINDSNYNIAYIDKIL